MKTKKATEATAAITNNQVKSYQKMDKPSSQLKEKIGGVLLRLAAGQTQPDTWQQFDQLLRQLYEGSTL